MLRGWLLILALAGGLVAVPGFGQPPSLPPPAACRVVPARVGYIMASAEGDSVYLGEPVLSSSTEEIIDFFWSPPPGSRSSVRVISPDERKYIVHTRLYFYYRATSRLGAYCRPVENLAADTSRSISDLLDEYFRSDPPPRPAAVSGYSAFDTPDSGSTHYLALWVALGGPPNDWRAPRSRDSCTFLGAVVVDRVLNRIIWSKGGHFAP